MAFGAPGIAPRWTSSAKEGLGTAYSGSCQLWFTLSHGIINEIYYPTVDQPNTRDFEFLISDGKAFCHEEKSDPDNRIDYPERGCLLYRLTNSERNGRYQIIKQVLADPDRSVLLMHTRLEVRDESLRGKLHLYALLAPHIARYGMGNSGWCCEIGANKLLRAECFGIVKAFVTHRNFVPSFAGGLSPNSCADRTEVFRQARCPSTSCQAISPGTPSISSRTLRINANASADSPGIPSSAPTTT